MHESPESELMNTDLQDGNKNLQETGGGGGGGGGAGNNAGLRLLDALLDDVAYARYLLHSKLPEDQVLKTKINWKDQHSGVSLLHIMVYSDLVPPVKLLLSYNAEVNIKNKSGEAPMHWCSKMNSMKTAKLLLDHKADVNVLDNSKSTPLHYAASMGNLEIIVLLLDYGADVNAIDSDNQVPMELAAENHQSLSYKAILIIFMRHYQKLNLALPRAIQLKFDLPMNGGNNNNSTLNTPATDAVTPSPTPQGNTQTASREEKTTQLDESNGNSNHHNAMNNDDHDMMATSSSSHKTLYDQVQTGQVGKHSSKKMNQGGVPFNPYMNDEPIEYGSSSRMNNYHALRNDMIQQQPHSMKGGNMMSGKQLQQQQQHSASMNSLLSSIQSVKRVDSNGSAGYMMKPSSTAVTQGANASPMRSGTAPGGAGGRGGEGENEYPPQKRFSIAMLSDPRVDKKLLSPLYGPRKVSFIALPNTGAGGRKSDVVLSSSTSTSPTQFAFDRDRSNSTSPTKGLPTNTAHTNSGASLLSPINEEHKFSHTHHHTKGGGSSGIDAQGSIHDLDSARTEESPAQSIISQHDNKGLIGIAPSRSASILVTAAAAGGETMEDPSVKTRGSMSSTAGIHPSMKKAIQFASHMMRVPKKLKDSPKHATSSDLYYQQQQMMIERTQSKEEKHEEFVRDKLALLFPPAEYIPFLPNPHPGLDHFFPTNFDIIVAIEHCTDCHLHGNSFVSHTTTNHPYHQSTKGGGHGNNNNNNNNNGNNPNANQHDPMKYIMVANQVLTQIITTMLHYRLAVRLYAMRCKPLSGKRIGGLEVTMAIYHANESSSHADLEEQGSMSMDEEGGKRMEPENKHTIENWITHTVFSKLDTKSWPNVKEVEQRAIHFVQSVFQECLPPEENRQGLHPSLQLNELSAERLKDIGVQYNEWKERMKLPVRIERDPLDIEFPDLFHGPINAMNSPVAGKAMSPGITLKDLMKGPYVDINAAKKLPKSQFDYMTLDHFLVFDNRQ